MSEEHLIDSVDRIEQFSKAGPYHPRVILEPFISPNVSTVLDIGTGSGLWALESARLGAKWVIAVDKVQQRIDRLSRKASDLGLGNVHAVCAVAEKLPVDSESIDVVVAGLVLHEVKALFAAVAEIYRVLKDEGTVVIIELLPAENGHHPRIDSQLLRGHLNDQGFDLKSFDEQSGWYCILASKGVRS